MLPPSSVNVWRLAPPSFVGCGEVTSRIRITARSLPGSLPQAPFCVTSAVSTVSVPPAGVAVRYGPAAMAHRRSHNLADFIFDNSLLLVAGTVAALVAANLDLRRYESLAYPVRFWVNDVGMVFFFALAAKEVFEATLPGGALASARRAISPLAAAIGGMAAPAAIYLTLVSILGPPALFRGWAIPCATDIAFSAMVARLIFPRGHPGVPFLLLLAIADDALGLVILALFYPSQQPLSLTALTALMTSAALLALWLRRRGTRRFWAYLIGPGLLSWAALYFGGFHPALALVPIVPFMPHETRDLGLFNPREARQTDTLNQFGRWWRAPVQFVLFGFGFANAGVAFAQIGPGTYYVVAALIVGKPIGILLFAGGARMAGAQWPRGMRHSDLLVVGLTGAIGSPSHCSLRPPPFRRGRPSPRPRWARS